MDCFESLGGDSEFALAQRAVGSDPLGFFRNGNTPLPSLLRALDSDFAGMDAPEHLKLTVMQNGEYAAEIGDTKISYPTGKYQAQIAPERLLAQQVVASGFLLRRLRQDLAADCKVFVRKAPGAASDNDARTLLRALRRYGPATLLWVVPEDPAHPAGMVRVLGEGLLKAYIDRFAPEQPPASAPGQWYDICRHAYALWRGGCLPGTRITRTLNTDRAANCVANPDSMDGPGWRGSDSAIGADPGGVPRLHPAAAIATRLLQGGEGRVTVQSHYIEDGLTEGEVYTGSMHVWIEPDFTGQEVSAQFDGYPSIRARAAELSIRGAWQRVWVAMRVPDGMHNANLTLCAAGPPGTRVHSTCWQLERGMRASHYVPGNTG